MIADDYQFTQDVTLVAQFEAGVTGFTVTLKATKVYAQMYNNKGERVLVANGNSVTIYGSEVHGAVLIVAKSAQGKTNGRSLTFEYNGSTGTIRDGGGVILYSDETGYSQELSKIVSNSQISTIRLVKGVTSLMLS